MAATQAELLTLAQAASLPEPAPGAMPHAARIFALGWQVAELYRPDCREWRPPVSHRALARLSSLADDDRVEIGLDQVQVALIHLEPQIRAASLTPPDLTDLRVATQADDAPHSAELVRKLHRDLLRVLTATDFRWGKAYSLGRALADTARNPDDAASLRAYFGRDRITELCGWLADLASSFPPHTAQPVRESMLRWQQWVVTNCADEEPIGDVHEALRNQARRWRALLSGEKDAEDVLELDDYMRVARCSIGRARDIGRQLVSGFAVLAVVLVVAVAAAVVLVLSSGSVAQVIAGLGLLTASLGVTWRGVAVTLGHLATRLEKPIWGAELDLALTRAITELPAGAG